MKPRPSVEYPAESGAFQYPISDAQRQLLTERFTYHAPTPEQCRRYEVLRWWACEYAQLIVRATPPGEQQAVALNHLQEAAMWANAAIAANE